MTDREDRREALVQRVADHLLQEGLAGASLRPMAKAAGTSDRMLLYYFKDRDELLSGALQEVAARLATALDQASGEGRRPFAALLTEVWTAFRAPALRPYVRLWLALAAAAVGGSQPERGIAGAIADGFLAWAEARLDVPEPGRAAAAALLLAVVDGFALLDAVGRGEAADRAAGLIPEAPLWR